MSNLKIPIQILATFLLKKVARAVASPLFFWLTSRDSELHFWTNFLSYFAKSKHSCCLWLFYV